MRYRGAATNKSKKTSIRLFSFACGVAIVLTALILQDELALHKGKVQIAIWSSMVLVVLLLSNRNNLREGWFWRGFLIAGVIHAGIVCAFRQYLPFSSLGIVLLVSFPEAIMLLIVPIVCQRMVGTGEHA
jgi:hypothetical protein